MRYVYDVYENILCRVATDFDARLCKIRRVTLPVDDDDVANKQLVQQSMQVLKNRLDEIESKLESLRSNADILLNYVTKHANFQRSIESNREEDDYASK